MNKIVHQVTFSNGAIRYVIAESAIKITKWYEANKTKPVKIVPKPEMKATEQMHEIN